MLDISIPQYRRRIGCTIGALAERVLFLVLAVVKNARIMYREKDSETLKKKILFKKRKGGVSSINDVYGLRIIVESAKETYLVFETVRKSFPARIADDFIAKPKELTEPGFEGKMLRLLRIVAYENGMPFEIQVTTGAFHEVNEAHHEVYCKRRYL